MTLTGQTTEWAVFHVEHRHGLNGDVAAAPWRAPEGYGARQVRAAPVAAEPAGNVRFARSSTRAAPDHQPSRNGDGTQIPADRVTAPFLHASLPRSPARPKGAVTDAA